MEVSGVLFRQAPCFSSTTRAPADPVDTHRPRSLPFKQRPNRDRKSLVVQFSDKSHLQYYNIDRDDGNTRSMAVAMKEEDASKKKKEIKKKLKLLEGLLKNPSLFSDLDSNQPQMTPEAVDSLLRQVQTLRAEEMELKKKKKEEKAKKKAARMRMMDSESSSSSSSESECEKVVDMGALKAHQETVTAPSVAPAPAPILKLEERAIEDVGAKCFSGTTTCNDFKNVNGNGKDGVVNGNNSSLASNSKKIEVCMGGKCKRSGAAQLLEKFQTAMGGEAAVVGCKCMGKCKEGPNVRVCNEDNVAASGLSLCIGVGLEDVDLIVANFFAGLNQNKLSPPNLDLDLDFAVSAAAAVATA